ncbi:MAG: isochorismate synthase [Ignavibacteria bacterium]|nr:isochorismate synthase [Ignavibacteria bacterium]MCU7504112.1 isochorismate synthase [Ignavibacteria bacterium]MCU7516438.1 isochorismate synthase [Ignavibacteria bacterium]
MIEKIKKLSNEYEKSFYWEKPSEGIAVIALGELVSISENGKGRFAAIEKKTKAIKEGFVSNWDELNIDHLPLFVGGMKFAPENHTEIWENYPDANWFVPKVLIYSNGDENLIVCNFLLSSEVSRNRLESEFELRISQILSPRESPAAPIKPKISAITGNTPKDKKKWMEGVKKAISTIEAGELQKIVLSRQVELKLNEEPYVYGLLDQLKQNYPECYLFAFHSGKSTFFGASPEKLMKLTGEWIEADALAGSAPRGRDEKEDKEFEEQLLKSNKDILEHNTVINYLENLFKDYSAEINYEATPQIKKLKNIQHLWTPLKVRLNPSHRIFSIMEGLHPTPAVCGVPQADAINVIRKMEDYHRGMYAGIIGWFNFKKEGEFAVAIRSALLKGKKLYAFAGGGIVEGSDPAVEYKETELKLKPILALFDNEN